MEQGTEPGALHTAKQPPRTGEHQENIAGPLILCSPYAITLAVLNLDCWKPEILEKPSEEDAPASLNSKFLILQDEA